MHESIPTPQHTVEIVCPDCRRVMVRESIKAHLERHERIDYESPCRACLLGVAEDGDRTRVAAMARRIQSVRERIGLEFVRRRFAYLAARGTVGAHNLWHRVQRGLYAPGESRYCLTCAHLLVNQIGIPRPMSHVNKDTAR